MVGLTGGIGSGKSMCAKIFEIIGIPVYYSDDRAKMLMVNDKNIVAQLIAIFGPNSYCADGSLNRPHLSQAIFNDATLLKKMNSVVHPAVRNDFILWHTQHSHDTPYTIQESALLFETGSYKFFDSIILVDAPKELRIKRVKQRDQVSRKEVLKRMDKQLPAKFKRSKSNYIIKNNGKKSVIRQVLEVHLSLIDRKT